MLEFMKMQAAWKEKERQKIDEENRRNLEYLDKKEKEQEIRFLMIIHRKFSILSFFFVGI